MPEERPSAFGVFASLGLAVYLAFAGPRYCSEITKAQENGNHPRIEQRDITDKIDDITSNPFKNNNPHIIYSLDTKIPYKKAA